MVVCTLRTLCLDTLIKGNSLLCASKLLFVEGLHRHLLGQIFKLFLRTKEIKKKGGVKSLQITPVIQYNTRKKLIKFNMSLLIEILIAFNRKRRKYLIFFLKNIKVYFCCNDGKMIDCFIAIKVNNRQKMFKFYLVNLIDIQSRDISSYNSNNKSCKF